MMIGAFSEVDDFVKTAPWGIEHTVTFHGYFLDGEQGWSVMLVVDPTAGETAEGLVYAYGPGKQRGALVGLASKESVYKIHELLRDNAARCDLRDLARQLQRYRDGVL